MWRGRRRSTAGRPERAKRCRSGPGRRGRGCSSRSGERAASPSRTWSGREPPVGLTRGARLPLGYGGVTD
eukprot:scaffold4698_cov115-Isochrysis_galbana.AAC.3